MNYTKGGIMAWEKTICYLCDKEAEKLWFWGNLRMRCFNCNIFYFLTSFVQKFRFNENKDQLLYENKDTRKKFPLTTEQKKNLLNYVKKNNDPEGKKPVKIDLKILDAL